MHFCVTSPSTGLREDLLDNLECSLDGCMLGGDLLHGNLLDNRESDGFLDLHPSEGQYMAVHLLQKEDGWAGWRRGPC